MTAALFLLEIVKVIPFLFYSILKACIIFFIPIKYRMKDVENKIILITGAGSGIGASLAVKFAKRKACLVLWDINTKGLEKTAEECRNYQSESNISIFKVDVTDRSKVMEAAEKVKSEIGFVDILVNNAGIVSGKRLLELDEKSIARTFNVNVISHFWTSQAFLPEMLARNSGHIVSIASMSGLFGISQLTDYSASKHAAIGFQESLINEIREAGKCGIHSTIVCPFYINTGMFDGLETRNPLLEILDPGYVTTKIETAILTNSSLLMIPKICYWMTFLKRLLPDETLNCLADLLGINKHMDSFVGRK